MNASATLKTLVLGLTLAAPGLAAVDRSQPPKPGAVRPLRMPAVTPLTLSNGLPVLLAASHEVPVAVVTLVVRGGAAADPADRLGVAAFAADMLDEGAGGRDALELADEIDFLGSTITTRATWDSVEVTMRAPVARLEAGLSLFADIALRPTFNERDVERIRKDTLTSLLQARDQPRTVGTWALAHAVFGEHRYGQPFGGNAAAVAAIGASDLRAFHARHFRPDNAALTVVGDVTPAHLGLFEKALGSWVASSAAGAKAAPALATPPQLTKRSVWLIDRPGSAQSVIRIGRVAPGMPHKSQESIEVMNTLLGGSFTSRLNDNLREQHGYSYGAGSGFSQRRVGGLFQAASDVQGQSTAEALSEFMNELRRIRTPATPGEVERARNYLALSYAGQFETNAQIASKLVEQWLHSLPADYYTSFVPRTLAVDATALRRAAMDHVDPDRMAIVVVGDLSKIEAKLRALRLGEVRIVTVDEVMGPAPKP